MKWVKYDAHTKYAYSRFYFDTKHKFYTKIIIKKISKTEAKLPILAYENSDLTFYLQYSPDFCTHITF